MSETVSIRRALRDAAARLAPVSESPRLDAELLLCRAIDMPRSYVFAHPDEALDDAALERFSHTVERRLCGEPLAYITGTKEFWSLELMVTPATLVPRPETEILVEVALRAIPQSGNCRVLDLGTGSGAIALALATERPLSEITAVDIRAEALEVAKINARELGIANVEFLEGNWIEPVADRIFDVVVSNPPYVAADDPALELLGAEPRSALVAGEDGLGAIEILVRECQAVLPDGGVLIFEHGSTQAESVKERLLRYAWVDIRCHNDYAGLPRVTVARKPQVQETP